jgi:hypothetical protein
LAPLSFACGIAGSSVKSAVRRRAYTGAPVP